MDLGPISGIPTIVLPNAQRAKKDGKTPDFQVGASQRPKDDPPKDQETPQQRASDQEEFHPAPEDSGPETQLMEGSADTEIDADGQHNWFV
jgi:hypothetical protein